MSSPELAFQTLVFGEIGTVLPGVNAGSNPVFNQTLPYVQFGQVEARDQETGHELLIEVHVWSEVEGPHQCHEYMHAIRERLHARAFQDATWHFNCVREVFHDVLLDEDEKTWHGVQRFRAFTRAL